MKKDRLPPIAPEAMSPEQRRAYDLIRSGPRKALFGPFIPLLRSPDLMDRVQKVGEYLRFGSVLPAPIREMLILFVSRRWTQQFEWSVHRPLGEKEGLKPSLLSAIAEGRRPEQMTQAESVACDFYHELEENRGVSDRTFELARQHFGEQGIVEIAALLGYYTMLAMVMNVARTEVGASDVLPLEPFPS